MIEYLKNLPDRTNFFRGEYKGWGYVYYINFYPSGLILRVESYTWSGNQYYYDSFYNEIVGPTQLRSATWLSPVPKTYEFLNAYDIIWSIHSSDWNEPTSNNPFYSCHCNLTLDPGTSNRWIINETKRSCSRILYIDHNLWNFRDNKQITEQQTEEDVLLYPIYKYPSESEYHLNTTSLENGTYNFLTTRGSLYQYDNTDLLVRSYVMTSNKLAKDELVSTREPVLSGNRIVINDGLIRNRYGAINNTGIDYDNGYAMSNPGYQDKEVNIINNSHQKDDVLYSNFPETAAKKIITVGECDFLIDNYFSYIGNKIIRHSLDYAFIKVRRKCTSSVKTAFDRATDYHTVPAGWKGNHQEYIGPGIAQGKNGTSYQFHWYQSFYKLNVSLGSVALDLQPGHWDVPGYHIEETPPATFHFKTLPEDYDITTEKLTSTGWVTSYDYLDIENKESEGILDLKTSVRFSAWHGYSRVDIRLYNGINTETGNTTSYQFIFNVNFPSLTVFGENTLQTFKDEIKITYNKNGSEKWLYPENPGTEDEGNGFLTIWGYNDHKNTTRAACILKPRWRCSYAGLLPNNPSVVKNFITNELYNWVAGEGWQKATWYEKDPIYQDVKYDIGDDTSGNYIGFTANFTTINADAVCILGRRYI